MKFRKKPVVIDAFHLVSGFSHRRMEWPEWLRSAQENIGAKRKIEVGEDHIDIFTLEGVMRANVGDWVIRGVKGELYPCKPDIFALTYEPVEEE